MKNKLVFRKRTSEATGSRSRLSVAATVKAILLYTPVALSQQVASDAAAGASGGDESLQEVVVTGTTSRDRTILSSSADIIAIY